jgi:hypothetical protein
VWCRLNTCLKSFLRRKMAFPTSQKLYNLNFSTDAQVSVETEAHIVHVHEQRKFKRHTRVEQSCESGACAHDVCLWA